jgi:hypothetical protein
MSPEKIMSGEPPEGVVTGESVPIENDKGQIQESKVEKMANALKTTEAFYEYSQKERREIARRKLEEVM